jgi:hypothetical protein
LSNGCSCTNCFCPAGLIRTAVVFANADNGKAFIDSESSTIFLVEAVIVIETDTGFRTEKGAFTGSACTLGILITGGSYGIERHAIAVDVTIGSLGTCGSVETG